MTTNSFQLTLRAARISCGYTALEAAKACGISEGTMNRYEIDSGRISRDTAVQLIRLYGISFDHVYIGKESDCFKHNRERGRSRWQAIMTLQHGEDKYATHDS